MCLGVPGRVAEIWDVQGIPMARVDFGGVHKEVCLAYVPEIEVGQYVIVHVGFAITQLDEVSALETLQLMRNVGLLDAELNTESELNTAEVNTPEVNTPEVDTHAELSTEGAAGQPVDAGRS